MLILLICCWDLNIIFQYPNILYYFFCPSEPFQLNQWCRKQVDVDTEGTFKRACTVANIGGFMTKWGQQHMCQCSPGLHTSELIQYYGQ